MGQGPADAEDAALKVHVVPLEGQEFALAHPRVKG